MNSGGWRKLGIAVAFMLASVCFRGWNACDSTSLSANQQDNQAQTASPNPEVPFELLYSRVGSEFRNFKYAVQSNDEERAVKIAQTILELPEDHMVSLPGNRTHSVKKLAFEYVDTLPRESLRKYQQRWELDAEVLLADAEASRSIDGYLKLLDRYYFTKSGFAAVDWLATRAFDLGQYETASRLWNQAIDSKVHDRLVNSQVVFKAAVANRLAGNGERAAELMSSLVKTDVGQKLSLKLETYLKDQAQRVQQIEESETPEVVTGWEYSLLESVSSESKLMFDFWRHQQWSDRKILSVPRSGVLSGDWLAIRDYDHVRLMNPKTGEVTAAYHTIPDLTDATERYERGRISDRPWEQDSRLSIFLEEFVWNTLNSQLSADSRHVYVIEMDNSWIRDEDPYNNSFGGRRFAPNSNKTEPRPVNRLIALPVRDYSSKTTDEWKPDWIIDGKADEESPFNESYFVAPPLNVDGILYALVDQEDTLKLVSLDPADGRLIWSQPLGMSMESLFGDSSRRWRGCVLQQAGEKLVMTTQIGIVVAFDPIRRTFEWVYYIGDQNNQRRFGFRGRELDASYGFLGFLDRPVIAGHQVYLMPRQSRNIHCLDLQTGDLVWKVPRNRPASSAEENEGDEYLGGVWDNTLLIVGGRETRGVSIRDGSELWRVSHARMSGGGCQIGNSYYLSLENSRLVRIQIPSGEMSVVRFESDVIGKQSEWVAGIAGDHIMEPHLAPSPAYGHLVPVGRFLVSLGIESVRAIPEPESQYRALQASNAQQSATDAIQFESLLLEPERNTLTRLEKLSNLLSRNLSESLRQQVGSQLERELFARLDEHPEEIGQLAESLKRFRQDADDDIRILMRVSQQQMTENDAVGLLQTMRRLNDRDSDHLFPVPGGPNLSVSLGAWMRKIWDWSQRELDTNDRQDWESFLNANIQDALASGDPREMERLLDHFPGLVELHPVRLELARWSRSTGKYHEAEMLLLTVANTASRVEEAQARLELASLWSEFRIYNRAAYEFRNAERLSNKQWDERSLHLIQELQSNHRFAEAYENLALPEKPVEHVTIKSHPPGPAQRLISEAYSDISRIYPMPDTCGFDLLAKKHSDFSVSSTHMLNVVSRGAGTVVAEIPIPVRGTGAASSRDAVAGHLFAFGSMGQIRGISLIDTAGGDPAWIRSFVDPDMGKMLTVGTVNQEIVSFCNDETVFVVEARNGRPLWRRDHLTPRETSNGSTRLLFFGDEKVVIRRANTASAYEVYQSHTGERVQLAAKPPNTGLLGSVGRKLVVISYPDRTGGVQGGRPRVSVIDLQNGREVFSAAYWSRHACSLPGDHLVMIDRNQQLRVFDVRNLKEVLSIPTEFGEADNIERLDYFSDAENHYINIRRTDDHQRIPDHLGDRLSSNHASNSYLPTNNIKGLLIAIDRVTGRRKWDRVFAPCSIIWHPYENVPFLTSLSSRVEPRSHNTRRLHLEIVSMTTGETLAETADFVPLDEQMQMIQPIYRKSEGWFELNGPMYRATVEFGPRWNRFLPDDNPF